MSHKCSFTNYNCYKCIINYNYSCKNFQLYPQSKNTKPLIATTLVAYYLTKQLQKKKKISCCFPCFLYSLFLLLYESILGTKQLGGFANLPPRSEFNMDSSKQDIRTYCFKQGIKTQDLMCRVIHTHQLEYKVSLWPQDWCQK